MFRVAVAIGAALVIGVIASTVLGQEQAPQGRYQLAADGDGFLRLDTQTGALSFCRLAEGRWRCEPAGAGGGVDPSILVDRLAALELQMAAMVLLLSEPQQPFLDDFAEQLAAIEAAQLALAEMISDIAANNLPIETALAELTAQRAGLEEEVAAIALRLPEGPDEAITVALSAINERLTKIEDGLDRASSPADGGLRSIVADVAVRLEAIAEAQDDLVDAFRSITAEDPSLVAMMEVLAQRQAAVEEALAVLVAPADANPPEALAEIVAQLDALKMLIETSPGPIEPADSTLVQDLSARVEVLVRAQSEIVHSNATLTAAVDALTIGQDTLAAAQDTLAAAIDSAIAEEPDPGVLDSLVGLTVRLAEVEQLIAALPTAAADDVLRNDVRVLGEGLEALRQSHSDLAIQLSIDEPGSALAASLADVMGRLDSLQALLSEVTDPDGDQTVRIAELQDRIAELTDAQSALIDQVAAIGASDEVTREILDELGRQQQGLAEAIAALAERAPDELAPMIAAQIEALQQQMIDELRGLRANDPLLDRLVELTARQSELETVIRSLGEQQQATADLRQSDLSDALANVQETLNVILAGPEDEALDDALAPLIDRLGGLEDIVGGVLARSDYNILVATLANLEDRFKSLEVALRPMAANPEQGLLTALFEQIDQIANQLTATVIAIEAFDSEERLPTMDEISVGFEALAAALRSDIADLVDAGFAASEADLAAIADRQAALEAAVGEAMTLLAAGDPGSLEPLAKIVDALATERALLRDWLDQEVVGDDAALSAIDARLTELADRVAALAEGPSQFADMAAEIDLQLAAIRDTIASQRNAAVAPEIIDVLGELAERVLALEAAIGRMTPAPAREFDQAFADLSGQLADLRTILASALAAPAGEGVEILLADLGDRMTTIESQLARLASQLAASEAQELLDGLADRMLDIEAAVQSITPAPVEVGAALADLDRQLADIKTTLAAALDASADQDVRSLLAALSERMIAIEQSLSTLAGTIPDPEARDRLVELADGQRSIMVEIERLLAALEVEPSAQLPAVLDDPPPTAIVDVDADERRPTGFGDQLVLRLYQLVGSLKRGITQE